MFELKELTLDLEDCLEFPPLPKGEPYVFPTNENVLNSNPIDVPHLHGLNCTGSSSRSLSNKDRNKKYKSNEYRYNNTVYIGKSNTCIKTFIYNEKVKRAHQGVKKIKDYLNEKNTAIDVESVDCISDVNFHNNLFELLEVEEGKCVYDDDSEIDVELPLKVSSKPVKNSRKVKRKSSKSKYRNKSNKIKSRFYFESVTEYNNFKKCVTDENKSCSLHTDCKVESPFQVYIYYSNSVIAFNSCKEVVRVTDISEFVEKRTGIPKSKHNFKTLSGMKLQTNSQVQCSLHTNLLLDQHLKGGVLPGKNQKRYHPDRECGPCSICSSNAHYNRYYHFQKSSGDFVKFSNVNPNFSEKDCVCRGCVRKLTTEVQSPTISIPSSSKIRKTACFLSEYRNCMSESVRLVDLPLQVTKRYFNLGEECNLENDENIPICARHYFELYKAKDKTCALCHCSTELFSVTKQTLSEVELCQMYRAYEVSISICMEDKLCKECLADIERKGFLVELLTDWKSKGDVKVPDLSNAYGLSHCIVFLCEEFLSGNAVLMNDIFDVFVKYDSLYCFYWKKEKSSESKKNVCRYLLNKLTGIFSANLVTYSSNKKKKFGKVLHYHKNDAMFALLNALNKNSTLTVSAGDVQRKSSNVSSNVGNIAGDENCKMDENMLLSNCWTALRGRLNNLIYAIIDKQNIGEIALETFNPFDFVLNNMDAVVWIFFYKFVNPNCAVKDGECYLPQPSTTTTNTNSVLRCLNLISSLMFCIDSRCNMPVHTLIAEVVDKYTGSSKDCLQILNNFGICISKDTFQRYQSMTAAKRSLAGPTISSNTFCYVSVDNINVRYKNAMVKTSDTTRGFDGTSVQLVHPKPQNNILHESEKGLFFKNSLTTKCGLVFKKISCSESKSIFRSAIMMLSSDFLAQDRSFDGFCLNKSMHIKEQFLVNEIEKEINRYTGEQSDTPVTCKSKSNLSSQLAILSYITGSDVALFENVDGILIKTVSYFKPNSKSRHGFNFLLTDKDCVIPIVKFDQYYKTVSLISADNFSLDQIYTFNHDADATVKSVTLDAVLRTLNRTRLVPKLGSRSFVSDLESSFFNMAISQSMSVHVETDESENVTLQNELVGKVAGFSPSQLAQKMEIKGDMFVYCCRKHLIDKEDTDDEIKHNLLEGFQTVQSKRHESSTDESKIEYLYVLEENADNKYTIQQLLFKLYDSLGIHKRLNYLVIVGDGKTYDHLVQLKSEWKNELEWMLPFIGDWHTLKNFQSVIMKKYLDLGLQQLIDLLHKGALAKIISSAGNFEKTHTFFLQVWESIFRFELNIFFENRNNADNIGMPDISELFDMMKHFATNTELPFVEQFSTLKELTREIQSEFEAFFKSICQKNATWRIWHQFVHEDLFTYIAHYMSMRSGNWNLRNMCLKYMARMAQVAGSTYYNRLLPQHLTDIELFPKEIIDHFESGGFTMNVKGFNWHSQALDEGHESCINRDIKKVLNTMSKASLHKFIHYMPSCAMTLSNLKDVLGMNEYRRYDMSLSMLQEIELNILKYIDKMELSSLRCNVEKVETRCISHLFNAKLVGSELQNGNLLNLYDIADAHFKQYVSTCIKSSEYAFARQKILKLTGFGVKKQTSSGLKNTLKDKQQELKMMKIMIEWSQSQKVPIQNLQQFISIPRAIATSAGDMYNPGSKSKVKDLYQTQYPECFSSKLKFEPGDCLIFDAMFLVNIPPIRVYPKFSEYVQVLFQKYVITYFNLGLKAIFLAFDCQSDFELTPKVFTRRTRDGSEFSETVVDINGSTSLPQNWLLFLRNRLNKKKLVNFISEQFLDLGAKYLKKELDLIIGGGFHDPSICKKVSNGVVEEMNLYMTNIDEGDSRVWFFAFKCTYTKIVIYSPDNDIYHIGLTKISKYSDKVFTVLTDLTDRKYISMNNLCQQINEDMVYMGIDCDIMSVLQMFYICTGCDYVSHFYGHGKASFYKTLRKHFKFINCSGNLGCYLETHYMEGFNAFIRFICCEYLKSHRYAFSSPTTGLTSPESLYLSTSNDTLTQTENHKLFLEKVRDGLIYRQGSEENYIPSYEALLFHWKRSCWVAQLWNQCNLNSVIIPEVKEYGWKVDGNQLEIIWDTAENIETVHSNVKLWTKGCSCSRMCMNKTCGCKKQNKYCGPACLKCRGVCQNKVLEVAANNMSIEVGLGSELEGSDSEVEDANGDIESYNDTNTVNEDQL